MDSLEFPTSGGSRILSESPQFSIGSSSHSTGPGGDDLSLSELYLDNRPPQRPAQARNNPKTRPSIAQALGFGAPIVHSEDASASSVLEEEGGGGRGAEEEWEEDDGNDGNAAADVTVRANEEADPTHLAARSREEKLRSDLFVLRQLNGAFAAYNDALRATQSGTEVSRCHSRPRYPVGNQIVRPSSCDTSESRSSSRKQTRCSTGTSTFYLNRSESGSSSSTSDGWVPKRYYAPLL
jgi:hypothetical protein